MESKLKQDAVKQYSQAFSDAIRHRAFQQKEKLNGQDILSLTPLKQVNLFVIKELFLRWKDEVEHLKSPYFNYEAEDVKSALASFMDVVSQNILIDAPHLQPLLAKATEDSLYLILAPFDYYYRLLTSPHKPSWTVAELEEALKYIRINRPLFERLVKRSSQEPMRAISSERILELFQLSIDQFNTPPEEDKAPYIKQFNDILPLQHEDLFSTSANPTPSTPPVQQTSIKEEVKSEEKNVQGPRTLNDYLNKSERSNLADMHQQKKIESLSRHISVNQKFMFIRELFNNDAEAFQRIIGQLDTQNSYAEAVNLIRRDLAQQYRWKMDSEEVLEFMELLSKRF